MITNQPPRLSALSCLLIGVVGFAVPTFADVPSVVASSPGFIQHLSLSPDGQLMGFASAGDIWVASSKGGRAERLTVHPADDARSAFSPDGRRFAFESSRDGARNLYVATLVWPGASGQESGGKVLMAGLPELGPVQRVTNSDKAQTLSGWSGDGKALLFTANMEPQMFRGTRLYSVDISLDASASGATASGGQIVTITDAFGSTARQATGGGATTFHRDRLETNRPLYSGSSASDLYRLNADKTFTQLTRGNASDGDGWPMVDGRIVFLSSRAGAFNVYRLSAGANDDSGVEQLTKFAKGDAATSKAVGHGVRDLAVSADGRAAVMSVWGTTYRLDLTTPGSQPQPITLMAGSDGPDRASVRHNASKEVADQAISPDGKTLAVAARGEIFIRATDEGLPTRRLTTTSARERDLAWSPDGRVLWFVSDSSGSNQVYYAKVATAKEDLLPKSKTDKPEADKPEADKEASKPDKAEKSDKPDEVAADAKGNEPEEASDNKDAKPAKKAASKEKKIDHGKRWAESLRYEIHPLDVSSLPAGMNDGLFGAEHHSPKPSPDGKKVIFSRGLGDLVLYDLPSKHMRVLLEGWNEPNMKWAGDSRHIVFDREDEDFNSDIFVMDTGATMTAEISPAVNLTRHPDNDSSPSLSADGKVMYFRSERGRDNDEAQMYMVYLDKKLESMRPYELEDYFKKAAEAAKKRKPIDAVYWDKPGADKTEGGDAKDEGESKDATEAKESKDVKETNDSKEAGEAADKPGEPNGDKPADKPAAKASGKKTPEVLSFDGDDAYLRVARVGNVPGSVGAVFSSPAGERVYFTNTPPGGTAETDGGLFSLSYKGDDRKSVVSGAASDFALNLVGDKVAYIKAGTATVSGAGGGGKAESLAIDGSMILDIPAQQRQKFRELARIMGNGFYHPTLKGLPWAEMATAYTELAVITRTGDEFDRVANLFMGELNASHTGVVSPGAGTNGPPPATGYLGISVEAVAEGLKVTAVVPESPADRLSPKLAVGDVITAVESVNAAGIDLHALMAGRAGKETLIDVTRSEAQSIVLVTPVSGGADTELRYRAEVRARAAKVKEFSNGKLGYLHIRAMSEPSVRDFERDLFAAADGKLGLIIDVRDNGGGSTADILLSSLTAPRHAFTASRGVDPAKVKRDAYPRDRRMIYGYVRPISVVINQNAFSNAEILAHAIKTIGRGKLVGTATYGGVISTGSASLIDGTTVRTPFRGWYLPDNNDMENNGAKPDIDVAMTPQAEVAKTDLQLKAAVDELLKRCETSEYK